MAPMIYTTVSNGVTLVILALSMALLYRQKGSYFKLVQPFLIAAYALLCIALMAELVIDILQTAETALWFRQLASTALLLSGLTLSAAASAITKSPSRFWRRLGLSVGNTMNRWLFAYTVYTGILLVLLWVVQPFEVVSAVTLYGRELLIPRVYLWYGLMILVSLALFAAYPCRLMIIHGRVLKSPGASKALVSMAVAWMVSGIILIGLRGVFRAFGLEVGEVANLVSAAVFSVTAYYFRKTDVLQSLFEETEIKAAKPKYDNALLKRTGWTSGSLRGKKILLEYEPSSRFETFTKEFVYESLSMSVVPVVVTRPGSPVHLSLREDSQTKFLLLSRAVSNPKQGASNMEVLLPEGDSGIILGALDKALNAQGGSKLCVVVDSLSDLLISWGIKQVYQFLTQCLVMLSGPSVSGLFLLNPGAHDSQVVSALRGLFPTIVAVSSDKVSVVKSFEDTSGTEKAV
ncbi:MAG: hypothetical protein HYU39_00580 [Thaumarchaeota archaeon]|nr:hypothetical protein [Nitrososphaerota archaeon]